LPQTGEPQEQTMREYIRRWRWIWAALLLAAFALAGCGGGDAPSPRAVQLASALTPSPLDYDMLLDWGEATYPKQFPASVRRFTKASPDYVYYYREYAATGNKLGVSGQDVYVQGPAVGGGLRNVGTVADYECDALPETCWPGASIEPVRAVSWGMVSYDIALPKRAYVIRNQQDWTAIWQELHGPASIPPLVDFNSDVVVGGTNGWGTLCGGFGARHMLRQGGDLRVLWGEPWYPPPMTACAAILQPLVAFVTVALPVTRVEFVPVHACWNPVPMTGRVDSNLRTSMPQAPAYVIAYRPGVDAAAETMRLQAVYGIAPKSAGATGFAADLAASVLAQMRCEPSISSIAHNQSVQQNTVASSRSMIPQATGRSEQ
jgi:hypothetical protein